MRTHRHPPTRLPALAMAACLATLDAMAADDTVAEVDDPMQAIASVRAAALAGDLDALARLMDTHFVWHFGPGGDERAEALDAWRDDLRPLRRLVRTIDEGCGTIGPGLVQCPHSTEVDWRAGFRHTRAGWRFAWFVAGD